MYRFPAKKPAGTALVVVLTFLIILSGLVVAFMEFSKWDLQTAQASTRKLQSQEIALGGAEAVTGLLLGEIASSANSDSETKDGVTLYFPKTDANAFPSRVISSGTLLPTLIKSSRTGLAPFAGGPSSLASPLPTTLASANGRSLDFTYWNTPQLLQDTEAGSFQSNAMPDWILVTKGARDQAVSTWSNALKDAASPDFVIGRYAYTMYDVSGLLDITVAGGREFSRSAGGTSDPAVFDAMGKPALVFADLTKIPGITEQGAKTFTEWRNATSGRSATDFHTYVFPDTDALFKDRRIRDFSLSLKDDNALFSRKDLIRAVEGGKIGITKQALPYLTTFSRASNAPSWRPAADKAAPYRYLTNANNDSAINRNLAWVRVKTPFIRPDGTPAVAGEPLIRQRFSFSNFARLTPQATANTTSDIYRLFGLTRSAAGAPWIYNHGSATRILRLSEVAELGREPDLAELMQATILNGSLASFAGTGAEEEKTHQILTILANIVDQQDFDNLPTMIRFLGSDGTAWQATGQEALPAVERIAVAWGDVAVSGTGTPSTSALLVPVLSQRLNVLRDLPIDSFPPVRLRMKGTVGHLGGSDLAVNSLAGIILPPPNEALVVESLNTLYTSGGPGFSQIPAQIKVREQLLDASLVGVRTNDIPKDSSGSAGITLGNNADPLNVIMEYSVNGTYHPYNCLSGYLRFPNLTSLEPIVSGLSGQTVNWNYSTPGDPADAIGTQTWVGRPNSVVFTKSEGLAPGSPVVKSDPLPLYLGVETRAANSGGALWLSGAISSLNATRMVMTSGALPAPLAGRPASADLSMNLPTYGHYRDLDGEVRKADGWTVAPLTTQSGVIPVPTLPEQSSPPLPRQDKTAVTGYVFNRPLRSPGETCATNRGQPWRTLDYWTNESADAGLLDLFTARDEPLLTGAITPNRFIIPPLAAAMAGTPSHLTAFSVFFGYGYSGEQMATAILNAAQTAPFANRAQLNRTPQLKIFVDNSHSKDTREQPVRGLSEVMNTRTWNVLIDVVGQSGRYAPSASALKDFQVQSETRYWVHVAIDRFTGKVVAKQVEPITD